MSAPPDRPARGPRGWLPHAALALWVLGVALVGRALHVPTAALERRLADGTEDERLHALFVLARRDAPRRFGPDVVRALLASPEPRLREAAMTSSVVREAPRRIQRAWLRALADDAERARCTQWLPLEARERAQRYGHAELVRYLEAVAAAPPGGGSPR